MVKLEIWEQRDHAESSDSSEEEIKARRLPLFDRVLPKAPVSRLPQQESDTSSDSDTATEDEDTSGSSYFHSVSESSDAAEEIASENAEYDADWWRLQNVRATSRFSPATYGDWRSLPRAWDSVFYISSMHNLENAEQKFFYCIRVKHVNERISRASGLGNIIMYTPHFTLSPGEDRKLQTPMFIWRKRRLTLPYGQLENYVIEIELWKTQMLRINSLYATQQLTFQEIVDRKTNFSVTLNMYIPERAAAAAGGSGDRPVAKKNAAALTESSERRFPVHKMTMFLLLEEVFDFFFVFENWWFTRAPELPSALIDMPKMLRISVPSGMGKSWHTSSTEASEAAYWSSPGTFRFQGTLRQLRYASFRAMVYCVKKSKFFTKPPALLGTCVLSLQSVQELPLVRGVVKKLTLGTRNMFSGTIQGNIRCCMKSCTVSFFEDLKVRPAQPISGSALITQLDHRCQYLVVRIISCSSLPASNTDSNTSDPMVKVKWDGIFNCTGVVESTVSPIYNQNMYFPIHLVDMRELTDPALIKHSLPVDLSSKGPVVVEVWDHSDASSEFLGSAEVPLSRIYTNGVLQRRSLADGIFTSAGYEVDESGSDESDYDNNIACTDDGASNAVYTPHVTRLYEGTLPLVGSTVDHRRKKPLVSLEMYILPPMPNDLYIPDDQKKLKRRDIYRNLSLRWTREFDSWQGVYCDRFPGAIARRRFTCVTSDALNMHESLQSDLVPLCYFVKPIQMYIQLSPPGELMHWISNFTYKNDGTATIGGCVQIETWQMPSRFVLTRKGGLHDRALLLCSCLLGLGYDAYVCKGTLEGGNREHCWVMTRHSGGTVTFWETANKRMWHMPMRWQRSRTVDEAKPADVMEHSGNYVNIQTSQQRPFEAPQWSRGTSQKPTRRLMNYELYGNDYMADVKVDLHRMMNSNEMLPDGSSALPVGTGFIYDTTARNVSSRRQRSIHPKKELLVPGSTLVFLPYSSIEVVFNDKQLWGNVQNHHPACITYDLEAPEDWRPFLKVPITDSVMPDVQITAPPPQNVCVSTAKEIRDDVVEMIELMYAQRGRVANVARDQQMDERLESLIDILEFRQRLDPQFDPGMPPHLLGWSTKTPAKTRNAQKSKSDKGEEVKEQTHADAEQKASLPITLQGHVMGDAAGKCQPARSDMEIVHQLAKAVKNDEGDSDYSDDTQASTDDTIDFNPATVPGRHTMEGNTRRATPSNQHPAGQQRAPPARGLRLISRMKALLSSAPKHHAMVITDSCPSTPNAPVTHCGNAQSSSKGFRFRKTTIKVVAPRIDVARAISNASAHLGYSNIQEMSDYEFEVETENSMSSGESNTDVEVNTPISNIARVTGVIPHNHPLSDYKQRIVSAIHLREPVKGRKPQQPPARPRPLKMPGAKQRPVARPQKRPRRGLLRNLWRRFRAEDIPDAHKVPDFMVDMKEVVNERRFNEQYMEHQYTIPTEFLIHEDKQISKWNWYYNMEARQYAWRRHLPIPPNHTFIGVPIRFSTSDINEIRNLLTCSSRCIKMLVPDVDRCVNVVYVKVFPLLGGVLSTWLFLGCHVPWNIQ
ncbi:Sma protein, putative [Babesia bigemina]|uniref:Sma protein, putative n=1 Tax=Babesia bigemina TaxID=5866 RepID=A0A061D4V2_BABBI|nr:Sma protein, putative [Babesia bigemina]CDR93984.1 Sma protein, putative [Babesia bigemina]|eukprot:XP_012766170.1 Sma protein, putative [Babesia bigemina]